MKLLPATLTATLTATLALSRALAHAALASDLSGRPPHPAIPASLAERVEFLETFQTNPFERTGDDRWVLSSDAKFSSQRWSWNETHANQVVPVYFSDERSVGTDAAHVHYGAARLVKPALTNEGKDLVVQYEVRLHEGVSCSGMYLKLISPEPGTGTFDPSRLRPDTPYSIMFGPDRCGATSKVHVIFRQHHESEGVWEEKHMSRSVTPKTQDTASHLYTLVVRKDQSFSVYVDGQEEASGSLVSVSDFTPPFGAPKDMDDPNDFKPRDWVDQPVILDPTKSKPEDWDENAPEMIPDPDAVAPEGWDVAEDGEWEAPRIPNPAFRGKWVHPTIPNPDYKGEWKPRRIPNPHYFHDERPADRIAVAAVAIEILANERGIAFDNLLITHDVAAANEVAELTFHAKRRGEERVAQLERRARAKRLRDEYYKEDPVLGPVWWVWGEFTDLVQDNLAAFVATTLAVLAGTVGFCCFSPYGLCYEDPAAAAKARAHAHTHSHAHGGAHSHSHGEPDEDGDGDEDGDEDEDADVLKELAKASAIVREAEEREKKAKDAKAEDASSSKKE